MALSEFDIIRRYFCHGGSQRDDVLLGVGDDAALLRPRPPQRHISIAMQTLVADSDFGLDDDPATLGRRLLANALCRLAASGADPAWFTLALTLPAVDEQWLQGFSTGLSAMACNFGMQLIGGDTTRGPLSMTATVHGYLQQMPAARPPAPGDLIYVTGTLGNAALAMLVVQDEVRYLPASTKQWLLGKLYQAEPPVPAGRIIAPMAGVCNDVQDGLVPALDTALRGYGIGATLYAEQLPVSSEFAAAQSLAGDWHLPLYGTDELQLCFTIAPNQQAQLTAATTRADIACTWIGCVDAKPGVRCQAPDGTEIGAG